MTSAVALDVSVALPPGRDTPALVALAEELGYERAWLYDSPALYHDVWMALARSADRTRRIGLGPAVLVPSLRHPMVNAAAVATLEELAPGRVAVALGAGFTGRHVLGHKAMRWDDVRAYVVALRGLLAGEEVEWEGRPIRMVHAPGYGAGRPIEVPILLGADGPRGIAAAKELADGSFAAGLPNTDLDIPWRALLQFGTVMDEGEAVDDPRVVEAAGPAISVAVHGLYERGGAAAVDSLPGGPAWRASLEQLAPGTRHLATHEGHLVTLSSRDREALAGGLTDLITAFTLSGTAEGIRGRVEALAASGVTELAYQPAASGPERDLRAFAEALGLAPAGT